MWLGLGERYEKTGYGNELTCWVRSTPKTTSFWGKIRTRNFESLFKPKFSRLPIFPLSPLSLLLHAISFQPNSGDLQPNEQKPTKGTIDRSIEVSRRYLSPSIKYGFVEDVFVNNSLISLYSACGFLNDALRVFDEMWVRDIVTWNSMVIGCLRNGDLDSAVDFFRGMERRNIITWNSIITGFVQGGRPKEAIGFFHEMQVLEDDMVRPDKMTVASVLSACVSVRSAANRHCSAGKKSRGGGEREGKGEKWEAD